MAPSTPISYKNLNFLITNCPSQDDVPRFKEELVSHKITDLVRVCDPSYDTSSIEAAGISVHDWAFEDGAPPPEDVIEKWRKLTKETFKKGGVIAVHCVAGLGRAPVLVCISLIEKGMSPEDAIAHVRRQRKGAINARQLKFLQSYKKSGGCVIM